MFKNLKITKNTLLLISIIILLLLGIYILMKNNKNASKAIENFEDSCQRKIGRITDENLDELDENQIKDIKQKLVDDITSVKKIINDEKANNNDIRYDENIYITDIENISGNRFKIANKIKDTETNTEYIFNEIIDKTNFIVRDYRISFIDKIQNFININIDNIKYEEITDLTSKMLYICDTTTTTNNTTTMNNATTTTNNTTTMNNATTTMNNATTTTNNATTMNNTTTTDNATTMNNTTTNNTTTNATTMNNATMNNTTMNNATMNNTTMNNATTMNNNTVANALSVNNSLNIVSEEVIGEEELLLSNNQNMVVEEEELLLSNNKNMVVEEEINGINYNNVFEEEGQFNSQYNSASVRNNSNNDNQIVNSALNENNNNVSEVAKVANAQAELNKTNSNDSHSNNGSKVYHRDGVYISTSGVEGVLNIYAPELNPRK